MGKEGHAETSRVLFFFFFEKMKKGEHEKQL